MYVYTRGEQDGVPGGWRRQDGISGGEQDGVPGGDRMVYLEVNRMMYLEENLIVCPGGGLPPVPISYNCLSSHQTEPVPGCAPINIRLTRTAIYHFSPNTLLARSEFH